MKTNLIRRPVAPEATRGAHGVPDSDLKQTPDEVLMEASAAGDTGAFVVLVERYQHDLYRYCRHFLRDPEGARDAAQEVFLRLCCNHHTFDTSQCFKAWFLRIARNVCLTLLQRRKRVVVLSLQDRERNDRGEPGPALRAEGPDPSTCLLREERFQKLIEAVSRLPIHTRQIVELRYFQQWSTRDIAVFTGLPEGAVRTRLHRALKRLRRDLEHYMSEP